MPNIGPRGRKRRLRLGLIGLAAGVVVGVSLLVAGVPRGWRCMAFLPLWVGWLGVFQARAKT
jgi:hypothetical protein